MKILLAVDGSDCSANAVKEVAARPWPEDSEVRILSVTGVPFPYPIPDPFLVIEASRQNIMQDEHERLEGFVEEMKSAVHSTELGRKLKIDTHVIEGSPKEVIVEEAEKWGADMVVVGCHGYGNVKKFLLGSVSTAVAAHAPCSVEIVRCKESHEG